MTYGHIYIYNLPLSYYDYWSRPDKKHHFKTSRLPHLKCVLTEVTHGVRTTFIECWKHFYKMTSYRKLLLKKQRRLQPKNLCMWSAAAWKQCLGWYVGVHKMLH